VAVFKRRAYLFLNIHLKIWSNCWESSGNSFRGGGGGGGGGCQLQFCQCRLYEPLSHFEI